MASISKAVFTQVCCIKEVAMLGVADLLLTACVVEREPLHPVLLLHREISPANARSHPCLLKKYNLFDNPSQWIHSAAAVSGEVIPSKVLCSLLAAWPWPNF